MQNSFRFSHWNHLFYFLLQGIILILKCSRYFICSESIKKMSSGFDINGCPIARGKWNASSGKWKRHPTCPKGQVKIILWYVQFLKSKMINIKFSVGSRGEFYLTNVSYISCIFTPFCFILLTMEFPFLK